jgi:hypothetical protein
MMNVKRAKRCNYSSIGINLKHNRNNPHRYQRWPNASRWCCVRSIALAISSCIVVLLLLGSSSTDLKSNLQVNGISRRVRYAVEEIALSISDARQVISVVLICVSPGLELNQHLISYWNSIRSPQFPVLLSSNKQIESELPFFEAETCTEAAVAVEAMITLQRNRGSDFDNATLLWVHAPLIFNGLNDTLTSFSLDASLNLSIGIGRINASDESKPFFKQLEGSSQAMKRIFPYQSRKFIPDWCLYYSIFPARFVGSIQRYMTVKTASSAIAVHSLIKKSKLQLVDVSKTLSAAISANWNPEMNGIDPAIHHRVFIRDAAVETSFNVDRRVVANRSQWPPFHILHENMINNTLVITSCNCGYQDFAQNWLRSVAALANIDGDASSILIIAEDKQAFYDLEQVIPGRVVLPPFHVNLVSRALSYENTLFHKFVASRPIYITELLTQGVTVLWTDVDMVWNRNPIPMLQKLQYNYVAVSDMNPKNERELIDNLCTGFMFLRPGDEILLKMLLSWRDRILRTGESDQVVFNELMQSYKHQLNFAILLPMHQFPPGYLYFGDPTWHERNRIVAPYFIHNNWIVGHDAKVERFKQVKRWYITQKNSFDICV